MLLRIVLLIFAVVCCYFLGLSHCQNQIAATKLKEVKNVQKTTAVIQAVPHASKPELLELMRRGKL